jgi:hypothetical protein
MSSFPLIASLKYGNPIREEIQFYNLVEHFDGAIFNEQRKQKQLYPTRNFIITCPWITKLEAQTLFQYFMDRKANFSSFYFFFPKKNITPFSFVKEYSFTGDGSSTVFNLPAWTSSAYTLYEGTNALTAGGTDWTFSALGGTDGQDKCTLTSASTSGAYYTFSFTGWLVQRMKFKDGKLTMDHFYDKLLKSGLILQGLRYDS